MEKEKLDRLKKKYPIGTMVRLISMSDSQSPPKGTIGKIMAIDDIGTIHTAWQNGSSLGLIEGVDKWEVVKDEKP